MSAQMVVIAGVVCVGGYVAYTVSSFDTTVFPYSREQAQTILLSAKTTLPRRDGPGQIQLWSTGRSAKGVALNMQYASWAPVLKCEAVITAVAADKSRVVADCGPGPDATSAIARTQDALRAPMFAEHIQATLDKRAFDRRAVDRQESALVLTNLGGMQREALRMSDEAQRDAAAFRR